MKFSLPMVRSPAILRSTNDVSFGSFGAWAVAPKFILVQTKPPIALLKTTPSFKNVVSRPPHEGDGRIHAPAPALGPTLTGHAYRRLNNRLAADSQQDLGSKMQESEAESLISTAGSCGGAHGHTPGYQPPSFSPWQQGRVSFRWTLLHPQQPTGNCRDEREPRPW